MRLEEIVKTYGMQDFYDSIGGKIYKLSEALEASDNKEELLVPVYDVIGGGMLIGYARMSKGDV